MIPASPNEDPEKQDSKDRSSNFEAVVSDKYSTNQCPLQEGVHRIWQCEAFKKFFDDRHTIVKEKKLCFSCLNDSHQIKSGKRWKCGIDSCEKCHNRLLLESVKTVESADRTEQTNLTTFRRNAL